jgi:hypothetical protein
LCCRLFVGSLDAALVEEEQHAQPSGWNEISH